MRVGVYAIAKDEQHHVKRWAQSAADADEILLVDTGSTYDTVGEAVFNGVKVQRILVDPWRFDQARMMALFRCDPDLDYVIALDLDEVLLPGWRAELERMHQRGVTRPRYKYTWSWNGSKPGLQYGGDKIHTRHDYVWRGAVHEVLTPKPGFVEVQEFCGLEIHHHPDAAKSRGQYLPLLELAVREDPNDDRNAHYYARELFFADRLDEAQFEFERHLALPNAVWVDERAQSMRYLFKITKDVRWLHRAYWEAPHRREAAVDAARFHYELGEWQECLLWAKRALEVERRPLTYLTEPEAWGPVAHDLAAVAAFNLGLFREADWHGMEALKLDPYDPRLVANVGFYRERVAA